jgi:O-antigen/teichoic acid export membrane protein
MPVLVGKATLDEDRSDYCQERKKGIALSFEKGRLFLDLKRNFTWMLGSKTLVMVAGFITAAMINRALGPSGRGIYAEIQTWIGLFAVLFGMSMDTAIYHFANRSLYGIDDPSRLITTLILSLIYGFLAMGAFAFFVLGWRQQVSSETFRYLVLLEVLLIASMLAGNLIIFLQAMGGIRYSAVIGVVQGAANVFVVGYAFCVKSLDIQIVLISILLIQGIAFLMLFAKFGKDGLLGGRFSKDLAKRIIMAGLKQHLATIATFVYTRINQLIVFRYCGESSAGIFAVSLTAALYLMFIPMTFQTVLYPRVIHAVDDYEVTIRSLRWGFYGWGIMVLLMFLFAKPILLLYAGSRFLPSVNNFRVLMVAAWFLPLSSILAPYYVKAGAFGLASISAMFLGIISICLNMFLVPRYADVGASLATALTCLIGFCAVLLFLWHLSQRNPLVVFHLDLKKEMASFRSAFMGVNRE